MTYEPFHIIASIGSRDTVLAMLEYPVDDVPNAIRVAGTCFAREEADMVKLHYENIPDDSAKTPKYEKYVPLVNEFAESGKGSARVDDNDEPDLLPTALAARLRAAISHTEHRCAVKVRQCRGKVYLVQVVSDMHTLDEEHRAFKAVV